MDAINCSFARAAVRTIVQMHYVPKGSKTTLLSQVFEKYSKQFADYPNMQLQKTTIFRNAITTSSTFNKRWNPNEMRNVYINTFSTDEWNDLHPDDKKKHTVRNCTACSLSYGAVHHSYPSRCNTKLEKAKSAVITLDVDQMSSPTKCGKSVLSRLNGICEVSFGNSAQAVLVETPNSKLVKNPNKSERRTIVRKIVTEIKE